MRSIASLIFLAFTILPSWAAELPYAEPFTALNPDTADAEDASKRPNVVLMIADDMSWKDWGVYGNKFARTPNIDKAAGQGVRFSNAYCTSTACHPSRSALLTGQDIWRLRDAAVFGGTLHNTYDTYPAMLREAGYEVAHSGKGWGPGYPEPGGWQLPPTGKRARLHQLLAAGQGGARPFCFWWGTSLGHRPFNYRADGRSLETIETPPYLPDTRAVREDFAGYYQEVEAFDAELGKVMEMLEKAGLTEETILIITSDHGMPWPRGKGSLYDMGTRVPLIVRWPKRIKAGRVVDDFVNFIDLAPTIVELAGLPASERMTGKSLTKILQSDQSGTIEAGRDRTHLALEAHHTDGPYQAWLGYMSCRAIRTHEYLYIRNYPRQGHPGWKPVQGGPAVGIMQEEMAANETVRRNFELCFGLRPDEELYDVKTDPYQIKNLAADVRFAEVKATLKKGLTDYMRTTDDPRATGQGEVFARYPIWAGGRTQMGGYNRSGQLELFDKSKYAQWMKENFVEPAR
jgi:arylsulfatase A-like enzyme